MKGQWSGVRDPTGIIKKKKKKGVRDDLMKRHVKSTGVQMG